MQKKKRIISLLVVAMLLLSAMSVMAASGSDTATGTISAETCTGTLEYSDFAGTAKSICPTVRLYRKSASISIEYYNNAGGPYYMGNASSIYQTYSPCTTYRDLEFTSNVSSAAIGHHSFENDEGYVKNLGTAA